MYGLPRVSTLAAKAAKTCIFLDYAVNAAKPLCFFKTMLQILKKHGFSGNATHGF